MTHSKLQRDPGICAGKATIASYLVQEHGFKRLYLTRTTATPAVEKSESNSHVPADSGPEQEALLFDDAEALLDFVTLRWKERWVTTDIWDETVLDILLRRPSFILVSVDAPVSIRWERFKARCVAHSLTPPDLASFVIRNDQQLYSPTSSLSHLLARASLRLLNTCTSLTDLHETLGVLDIPNEERLRPTWDTYFMRLASLAAQRSNCMKRRVGAVLVGRERRVISTGYNGTPRGMRNCNEGGCPRCNAAQHAGAGLDTCLCIHAEENALLEAGRERIREGAVIYCNTCPCLTCSVKIAQVGITEVVYSQAYSLDDAAKSILAEAGVKLRQFLPPREGLVDLTQLVPCNRSVKGAARNGTELRSPHHPELAASLKHIELGHRMP